MAIVRTLGLWIPESEHLVLGGDSVMTPWSSLVLHLAARSSVVADATMATAKRIKRRVWPCSLSHNTISMSRRTHRHPASATTCRGRL